MSTFFKNTELAIRYNISEATVRNWIRSSKEGKLKLELIESRARSYVANSISNIALIDTLVQQNRKYRNTNAIKTVSPTDELLRVFDNKQVHDIVRNLELHREIPRQYGYFAEAAGEWDEYINKQMAAEVPSVVRSCGELLDANFGYIDQRTAKYKKINLIDVGVGNGVPVRRLISHLRGTGKLGRYVALDFSEDMLNITKRHMKEWFGDDFSFEGHQFDMTQNRFTSILTKGDAIDEPETINLVLLLGATPNNLRIPEDAFRNVCESMAPHDLLVYTDRVETTVEPPEWFRHSYEEAPKKFELLGRHRFVLDRLGITESFYDARVGFDVKGRRKYACAKLKFALNLKLDLGGKEKIVQFEKGDNILVWQCWRWTSSKLIDILESCGFYVAHLSQTEDRYVVVVAEITPNHHVSL